ncbi:phosphotransferase [Rhodococcus hoagii]|nr:phosphotransferase [Prescottella equi]
MRRPATRFGGGVGGHPLHSRSGVTVAGTRRRRRRRRPAQARRQRAGLLRVDAPRGRGADPAAGEGVRLAREHWPSAPSEPVLCWGDSRIGNIMYRDFAPVAVLDWELAALAPREVDVGWFVFFHRMFQDMAEQFGRPGLPHLLRREEVVALYEETTGVELRDLDFYLVYAAVRHGIIMSRIKRRSIHFGDSVAPSDPDEYVLHHRLLRRMIDGEPAFPITQSRNGRRIE